LTTTQTNTSLTAKQIFSHKKRYNLKKYGNNSKNSTTSPTPIKTYKQNQTKTNIVATVLKAKSNPLSPPMMMTNSNPVIFKLKTKEFFFHKRSNDLRSQPNAMKLTSKSKFYRNNLKKCNKLKLILIALMAGIPVISNAFPLTKK
jgi:hypothetical protein